MNMPFVRKQHPGTYPEREPQVFVLRCHLCNRPIRQDELESSHIVNTQSILIAQKGIACKMNSLNQLAVGKSLLTAAESQTGDTNSRYTPSDNVQSKRYQSRICFVPCEASSQVDGSGSVMNLDIIETRHRNLDATSRGEPRVDSMATTFHRERRAG
jgi:hypothetical protein